MTYRILVQPCAERDINSAALWILGQPRSQATAVRWARNLRTKIAALKVSPERCPIDPDSAAYGEVVRVLLYGKRGGIYRVLFAIRGATVHVLTVRHSAQRSLAEELAEDERDQTGEPRH